MSDGWHRKLEELFEALIDLDPAERQQIIDRECAADERLRRELETLLAACQTSSNGLPPPGWHEQTPGSELPAPGLPGPGDLVAHYEIVRELGRGGMGAVYLARDTRLDRQVAIKFLLSKEPEFLRRFAIEARAIARCVHDNIVAIHAADEHEGNPYLVLAYHQGKTLEGWLESWTMPLPAERAVALLLPVVRALECAHEQGIIHRDLKPGNILVADSGPIKVLDFGIAKMVAGAAATTAPGAGPPRRSFAGTRRGLILGTMPYMSPEQWGADEIDHRSDLWAVGIMLYEMVIGSHPLAPLTHGKLLSVGDLDVPMPSARAASPGLGALADIIDLCLIKPRRDRIASASELRVRLEGLGAGAGKQAAPADATRASRPAAQPDAGVHRASDAAALEFASIVLERGASAWLQMPGRIESSPFDRPCLHHLQLQAGAETSDLLLDVTILNLASRPLTVSHVGLDVVELSPSFAHLDERDTLLLPLRALPAAGKVAKHDAYAIGAREVFALLRPHLVRVLKRRSAPARSVAGRSGGMAAGDAKAAGSDAAIVTVGETAWSQLPDPVYLSAGAPYRFGLSVGFQRAFPGHMVVRLAVRTQLGIHYSDSIETSMGL